VLAFQKYLILLDKKQNDIPTDKYWSGGYTSILFSNNGIQYLTFCWGIPKEIPEILIE
jgi:hypothetical protein